MWQVSGRSDITDFEEVVRLDKEYIDRWNILDGMVRCSPILYWKYFKRKNGTPDNTPIIPIKDELQLRGIDNFRRR